MLSVDGRPAEEVYEAVRSVASIDNEMGLKAAAPFLIGIPEVLHALGVTNSLDKSTWEFATSEGQRLSVPVERVTDGMERTDMPGMSGMTSVGTAHVAGTAQAAQAPVPLYLKSPHEAFWLEYLRDQRTIYVQCNSVRDKVDETFEQFYGWVFAFVEEHPVEKMVLDIRNNGGGNNLLNQSLIHRLICCDRVNRPGRLFTIIGRRTFSAAMNLANDLEKHTNTVFVGEPTGSSPNHFGDAREHKLLNSGVAFHVSTLYWQYSVPQDSRPWITPDIPAELSSEDYRAQRDPAMEAILNIEPASVHLRPFADRLHQAIRACGIPETKQ